MLQAVWQDNWEFRSGIRLPEFETWLPHQLQVWYWASPPTPLCLSVITCKVVLWELGELIRVKYFSNMLQVKERTRKPLANTALRGWGCGDYCHSADYNSSSSRKGRQQGWLFVLTFDLVRSEVYLWGEKREEGWDCERLPHRSSGFHRSQPPAAGQRWGGQEAQGKMPVSRRTGHSWQAIKQSSLQSSLNTTC